MTRLELLEQTGILRLLLLLDEKQRYVTEILKSLINPEGIMSQDPLKRCRTNLSELRLIEEHMEEGARPKTFLTITQKGRRVVAKLREIERMLED